MSLFKIKKARCKPDLIDGMRVILHSFQGLHGKFAHFLDSVVAHDSHHVQHFEHEDGPRCQFQEVVRLLRTAVPFEAGEELYVVVQQDLTR